MIGQIAAQRRERQPIGGRGPTRGEGLWRGRCTAPRQGDLVPGAAVNRDVCQRAERVAREADWCEVLGTVGVELEEAKDALSWTAGGLSLDSPAAVSAGQRFSTPARVLTACGLQDRGELIGL